MKTLAFDARPAQRPPHSFRRLLELFYDAAKGAQLPIELWNDGPLHSECEQFSSESEAFPKGSKENTVMWCLTPDRPSCEHQPYIAMICDVNPLLPDGRSWFKRWKRGRAFCKKVDYAIESAWRIATDSHDAHDRLVERFPAIKEKLFVIPLYAAPGLKAPEESEQQRVLEQLDLKAGYIFFVGSFRRHKNWQGLMESYALLPKEIKEKHPLVFSGAVHRDKASANRLLEKLHIQPYVRILGETAEEHLPTLYAAASLFVFPSYMEGFGLPPLEAMQCGTPVVASNRTSIPEVLGDAARYVEPDKPLNIAQTIMAVLGSPELQEEMIEAGYKQAASFNAARSGEAILKMLS